MTKITMPAVTPPQRPVRFASHLPVHHGQMRKHIADTLVPHVNTALEQLTRPISNTPRATNRKVQARALLNTYLMATTNAQNQLSTLQ